MKKESKGIAKVDQKLLKKHGLQEEPSLREIEHAIRVMAYFEELTKRATNNNIRDMPVCD